MPRPHASRRVTHEDFLRAWLKDEGDSQYANFACTSLHEVDGTRMSIQNALSEAIFVHHNDPATYRKKLAHLGFPATADALDRRPRSVKTRLANFGEVIASEFLRQLRGYSIPVYRLRYNCNDESSPKGDDVLAFEFADPRQGGKDTVIVAEVKVRTTHHSNAVVEAHDALLKGHRPRPKSFPFVVDVLFKEGRDDEAKRLLDLAHKFGKRSLKRRSCLFLVTGNCPPKPFAALESQQKLVPNLETVHLPLDGLGELVASTFARLMPFFKRPYVKEASVVQ